MTASKPCLALNLPCGGTFWQIQERKGVDADLSQTKQRKKIKNTSARMV
jgi:hypothetical protein